MGRRAGVLGAAMMGAGIVQVLTTAEEVDQPTVGCLRRPTGPLAMARGAGTGRS